MTEILKFITTQRIASVAIQLPDDTIHAAALHVSHGEEPFELYFSTDSESRKCHGLLAGESRQAAVVIGFSTDEWITLQLNGKVQIVQDKDEITRVQEIHYAKHPHSAKYKDEPTSVMLKFTPHWWRYTDFNTKPVTMVESN